MFNKYLKELITLLFVLICCFSVSAQKNTNLQDALLAFSKLDNNKNYTDSLTEDDLDKLPVGIKKTISNVEYTVAISDVKWLPSHAELTVFARMRTREDVANQQLMFGASGIKLSYEGQIFGDAQLVLMDSVTIPIDGGTSAIVLHGHFNVNTGRIDNAATYVTIDCKGFKELGISGHVEVSEKLVTPYDLKNKRNTPGRVQSKFKLTASSWTDILVDLNFDPFTVNALSDFVFVPRTCVLDFSTLRNSSSINFPSSYTSKYMVPGHPELWRGVYFKELLVALPPFFSKNKEPVFIEARNAWVDNHGLSGIFKASNVLPIEQGTLAKWQFSITDFLMELQANTIVSAGFGGKLRMPVSEKTDFTYEAMFGLDGNYSFLVRTAEELDFSLFGARAEIDSNSYVRVTRKEGEFVAEAMLHGSMTTNINAGEKKIGEFKGLLFEGLHLTSNPPYFEVASMGWSGESKLANFPISITSATMTAQNGSARLDVGGKVTLGDNAIEGKTVISIYGKLEETELTNNTEGTTARKIQKWRYDKTVISEIEIDAKIASIMTLKGKVNIRKDDSVYGDGFGGELDLKFDKVIKGVGIKVRCAFGRTEFKYWFVDGIAHLGRGIPAFPPVTITGIGGGISNRMKRDPKSTGSPFQANYIPDKETGLGFKAIVLFNVAAGTFNGEASFEVSFNRHGGLNFIGFYGFAKFMGTIPGAGNLQNFVNQKVAKAAELEREFLKTKGAAELERLKIYTPNKAAEATVPPAEKPGQTGFAAAVGIQFDFTKNSLHATFDLYVNAIGGLMRGTASGNRAGWAVLHIEPGEWYIHMGTPTDRIGLKFGIGSLAVETNAYLMLGSKIPGSPPPPKQVADILGVSMDELDYMRDLNALGEGKGFAFGASVSVSTGEITFLILYAKFEAGLGFDIMLKDYGDAQCRGRSGTIGIDGWYANGQAYVYLQGELGVKVNLKFIKGKYPIIQGGAAALIQAKLPNPAWFRGYLGVKFSVLGGLVKGRCRFKFTIGQECELVIPGGSPIDIEMITDIAPSDRASEVDVFSAPEVTFATAPGKPFSFEFDNGRISFYRIALNELSVMDGKNKIDGTLQWSEDGNNVQFLSNEVLPPGKNLKISVKVGFEEYKGGTWQVVYTGGLLAQEKKEISFTTGNAPEKIPVHNIDLAYPIPGQKFFLEGESNKGVVRLKRGQNYLFSNEYKNEIHFLKGDGTKTVVQFTYDNASRELRYIIPDLDRKSGYSFNLVSLKARTTDVKESLINNELGDGGENSITVSKKKANTVARSNVGFPVLDYEFYTSQFATLKEKVESARATNPVVRRLSFDLLTLELKMSSSEPFDDIELIGGDKQPKPLIEATAILDDSYYREDIQPYVYAQYPVLGLHLNRDTTELGFPPRRALPISSNYLMEIQKEKPGPSAQQEFPFIYNLPAIYKDDFQEMQHKIINSVINTPQRQQYSKWFTASYPFQRGGQYRIKLVYVLPDGTRGTNCVITYQNLIE